MAYMDKPAIKRENPIKDRIYNETSVPVKDSKQELTQNQRTKFRTVSTAPIESQNVGNIVKVQPNNKGTGVAGRPSGFGEAIRDTSDPAKANPSGAGNQTSATYWS